jgi:hypothetical protein
MKVDGIRPVDYAGSASRRALIFVAGVAYFALQPTLYESDNPEGESSEEIIQSKAKRPSQRSYAEEEPKRRMATAEQPEADGHRLGAGLRVAVGLRARDFLR